MNEPYKFYEQSADYVRARMPFAPQIAVILGSSLGPFAKRLQNTVEIDYHDIPNFPVSTAPGHAGKLIFGELAEKRLVCLAGRFHSYEGYDFAGWYTEQNGGTKIESDTTVTVAGTQTLYAHWTEHEYTVTVVKIGMPEWGSVTPMSIKAKAGETVTLTATPTTGNQLLDGGQSRVDAVLVGDDTIFHRNVEIAADKHFLAAVILIVDRLLT